MSEGEGRLAVATADNDIVVRAREECREVGRGRGVERERGGGGGMGEGGEGDDGEAETTCGHRHHAGRCKERS